MEIERESEEPVKKLEIDRPSDFKYHAAYVAYSKTWDDNLSNEARNKLNDLMKSLSDDNYFQFYTTISQFRKDANIDLGGRQRFRAQSKRAWKRGQAKAARISRHKK